MITIERTQNIRLGVVLMMSSLLLFTVGEVLVKYLIREHDVTQIVWARYTFHALATAIFLFRTGIVTHARTSRLGLHLTRSALMLLATTAFFLALRYLPLADAVAINFITPVLVTAFSIPILKEHVGIRRWVAILVGFCGVMIIIRPGMGVMHWAAVLPLCTAAGYAFYQVLTRVASRTENTNTSLFWTSVFGVLVSSCAVPFFWTQPSATAWIMMVALGGVYGFGHYLLIRGLEIAPASVLSPFFYTQIVWATLFGFIFFDHFPDVPTLIGLTVVMASGLYIWKRETVLARKG